MKYTNPTKVITGPNTRFSYANVWEAKSINGGAPKFSVYICSPYSGNTRLNTANARRYCRYAVDKGCIPLAPHLLFPQFMNEENERETAMFMNYVLLTKCRELWVFGRTITAGMSEEIEKAKQRKIRIRYFTEEIKEVND